MNVPPKPTTDYAPKKPKIQVDTSKITAGSVVIHKAFGAGQVKGIDGALIVVSFKMRFCQLSFSFLGKDVSVVRLKKLIMMD